MQFKTQVMLKKQKQKDELIVMENQQIKVMAFYKQSFNPNNDKQWCRMKELHSDSSHF